MVALKKFGLANYNSASDADVYNLVGAVGDEGAFWSAGVAKGKGFSGSIIFNIYAIYIPIIYMSTNNMHKL